MRMTILVRLLVVICLLFSLLAGCSSGSNTSDQDAVERPQGEKKRPLVVITTAKSIRDYDRLLPGDTFDNNPITRWAKEKLGIIQKNIWMVTDENGAMPARVRLALSSGELLPDILYLTDKEIPELLPDLVASGQLMSMEEAFEKHAPERVKEAFKLNPDVWRTVMLDGKAWAMPQISDGRVGNPILWIRQDWLDRLKLKAPVTLSEVEHVLEQFTHADPDGNGQHDTFGLALAGKNTLNGWMADASFVFGAYGNQPYQWNRMKDGTLQYGSIQPEVKQALAQLADWYAQGYMHKDFGTHDEQEAVNQFLSGQAGVLSGPGWMGGWPLSTMPQNLPGAVIQPYPYPTGPDGKIGRIGTKISYGAYFIRHDFKHMDLFFEYWDEVYGALIEDPESDFAMGFSENYDYKLVDGKPVYDFPERTISGSFLMVSPGSRPPGTERGKPIEERVLDGEIDTTYEQSLAAGSSRLFLEGQVTELKQPGISHRDEFYGQLTPTMLSKGPLLKKLEKETFLRIVYGDSHSDAFDEFVEQWKKFGGHEITQEVNDWDQSLR